MPLIALAVLLLAATTPDDRGRLCVAKECRDTTGTRFAVAPADRERAFIWTSADASTVRLGSVAAKAESIDFAQGETTAIELTLEGDAQRGWPVDVETTVNERWQWTLDAEAARRLRRIIVPRAASYALGFDAEHHQPRRVGGIAANSEVVKLGAMKLAPQPTVRGSVVDRENQPLANATIAWPEGAVCTMSDAQGAFVCEVPKGMMPPPRTLVVSKGGYASRTVELRPDVGPITLTTGHTLTFQIVRPEEGAGRVLLMMAEQPMASTLAETAIREAHEEVRFQAGDGTYFVLVEGSGALERLAVQIEVRGADLQQEIVVEPYRLTGTARFGEAPLEGAIVFRGPMQVWRASLPVREGEFAARMWQHGKLSAHVTGKELGTGELLRSPELGADPSHWDITIARRLIHGRVTDAETGKPFPRIELRVGAVSGDRNMSHSVQAAEDGSYELLAHRPGVYSIAVEARGYAPFTTDIQIGPDDTSRELDIALERGGVQMLHVFNAAGQPAISASILEGVRADRANPRFMSVTDALGRFEARGKPGETRVLFIAPRDGSFTVVRVPIPRPGNEAKPMEVRVAPPTATLRLQMSGRHFLLRYNGEFIPFAMLMRAARPTPRDGVTLLQHMPLGAYEIWALADQAEEERMIASNGTLRPPVRVTLTGGEHSVTLTR